MNDNLGARFDDLSDKPEMLGLKNEPLIRTTKVDHRPPNKTIKVVDDHQTESEFCLHSKNSSWH